MLRQHAVDDRLYGRPVGVGDEAVVQRDRCLLGFDHRALDRVGLLAHAFRDALDQLLKAAARLVFQRALRRTPDIETVAPATIRSSTPMRPWTTRRSRPLTTQNRAALRKSPDRRAHALRDDRVLRPVDDRSQRAVVVEEDRRTMSPEVPRELVAVAHGVGQRRDARPGRHRKCAARSSIAPARLPSACAAIRRLPMPRRRCWQGAWSQRPQVRPELAGVVQHHDRAQPLPHVMQVIGLRERRRPRLASAGRRPAGSM